MTVPFRFSARRTALHAALALPGLALAQTAPPPLADPAASVPPAHYQTVFAGTPGSTAHDRVDWKKANADLGASTHHHGAMDMPQHNATPGTHPAGAAPTTAPPAHAHHH